MRIARVDTANVQGLADTGIGLTKEVIGTLVGRDRFAEAGRVQQEKGTERLKALRDEAKAKAHKAKAHTR